MTLTEILDGCAATHRLTFDESVPDEWRPPVSRSDEVDHTCLVVAVDAGLPALPPVSHDAVAVIVRGPLGEAPLRTWARILAKQSYAITQLVPMSHPEPMTALIARRWTPDDPLVPRRFDLLTLAEPATELLHRLNREVVIETELTSRTSALLQRYESELLALQDRLLAAERDVDRLQRRADALDTYRQSRTYRAARRLSVTFRRFVPRRDR